MQAVYFPKSVNDMEKNPKMWPYTKSVDVDAPGSRVLNYAELPNSEQSYKGKVKTDKYINRQNQSTTCETVKTVMTLT